MNELFNGDWQLATNTPGMDWYAFNSTFSNPRQCLKVMQHVLLIDHRQLLKPSISLFLQEFDRNKNVGLLLLCEVALGDESCIYDANYDAHIFFESIASQRM